MTVPVARLGNTEVCVHVTFLLAAFVLAVSGYAFHLVVFLGSLLFHELGHIMAASWMGAEVAKVVVWPFGAMAKIERTWQLSPTAEGFVAFMGPFNSGLLLALTAALKESVLRTRGIDLTAEYPLLALLQSVNLYLFAVNLLPCLPLDGGRIARSRLALKVGYVDASAKTSRFGLCCGVILTLAGLTCFFTRASCPSLLITGAVVWWGAFQEREDSTSRNIMELLTRSDRLQQKKAIPVEEIMVLADARVKDVVGKLRPSRYNVILVAGSKMRVMGRVSEAALLEAFYKGEVNRTMKELLG